MNMAKRKKYPKLPNGYGQIRFLGSNRRNPYGVYPPATEEYSNGQMKPQKALCYVPDWTTGFAVLTAYRAGTYIQGMEKDFAEINNSQSADKFIQSLLANYNLMEGIKSKSNESLSFKEVFYKFYKRKFGHEFDEKVQKRSSLEYAFRAGFKNCQSLHDRIFTDIVSDDLQEVMDNCTLKHASVEHIQRVFRNLYKYAIANDIVKKDYSAFIEITQDDDDEHGIPFSKADIKKLWDEKENEIAEMLIIMCYSGFRITEYKTLEVNLKEKYFLGGIKTDAGKDRIVPIHSAILPLVVRRIKKNKKLLLTSDVQFRKNMYALLSELGIAKHTPHDCRHTFSKLCEDFEVKENDRKRMLGHAFKDVTNKIYGHRDIEDLRTEIEKIASPDLL